MSTAVRCAGDEKFTSVRDVGVLRACSINGGGERDRIADKDCNVLGASNWGGVCVTSKFLVGGDVNAGFYQGLAAGNWGVREVIYFGTTP